MAEAKKCDICGKLYEEYLVDIFGENVNGIKFSSHRATLLSRNYDCCPECLNSIANHIKSLRSDRDVPKVNLHSCDTCLYQDSGSYECATCISDNRPEYRLTSIPSNWRSKEPKFHKVADDRETGRICVTCKYFKNEPDSDYCYGCPTPEDAHSKWQPKE